MTFPLNAQGSLFIVAAPSGAGKSSLVKALLERESGIYASVSHTTRPPRAGELEGIHYHYVSSERFQELVGQGQFIECANVHGHWYGTSRSAVLPLLAEGKDVLLEIDYQGAKIVRAAVGDCVGIFILPPSRQELERRLRLRAQDAEDVIQKRLANSREEIAHACEFNYIIVNQVFDAAVADLLAIVRCQRLRQSLNAAQLQELIRQLIDHVD